MSAGRPEPQWAPAAGALVTVALLLAGACTGRHPAPETAPRDGPATTRATAPPPPDPGPSTGTIRLGVPAEPASLDPFDPRSRTLAGEAVLGQVLPQLFRVDPAGRVVGWLADEGSVRLSPDGREASFALRAGARWSDGAPIAAEDLRFTLECVRGGAWPGPRAGYDHLVSVDGAGTEVTLRFDRPYPGWRRLFSGEDWVLPAHRLAGTDLKEQWPRGPDISGGPFRLGPVSPGLSVRLERNDTWWGGRSRAAAITVEVVPDGRTMEQLLARGELDVAWPPVAPNRVVRFRALAGVAVSVAEPGGALESLVANTATLSEERRRALLGLMNRDRFVDVLLSGEAERAVSLAGPGASGGPAPTWATVAPEPPGERLRGAPKATLASADDDQLSGLVGRVLQSGAQAGGATVELKSAETTTVDGAWLPEGRFDLALARTVSWPEPCWGCWFGEAAVGRGNTARAQGLDAPATTADDAVAGAEATLEQRVRAGGVMLPLWRPRAVLAGRGVGGLVANSWSLGPFWSADQWVPPTAGGPRG